MHPFVLGVLAASVPLLGCVASSPTVITTSGKLVGINDGNGVISFKSIPFAQAPTGNLRWQRPVPFVSGNTINATTIPPSCLQQFAFASQPVSIPLFNTPPPPSGESEDCLFINVWAPASTTKALKPVIFWIYGGALQFGTGSLLAYDGTSIARNQDLVVVTFNYRTNIFGFPLTNDTSEIPIANGGHNLGLLDQELALTWTRANIARFGGDPDQIFIMGQSAGASSVTWFLQRHPLNPPFAGGILLSSAFLAEATPTTDEAAWTEFAAAVGCTQPPGSQRLACLKAVPADTIHTFMNGPNAPPTINALIDNFTVFPNPVQRILNRQVARVPLFQGDMEDDGSLFVFGQTNVTAFLDSGPFDGLITPEELAPLYPNLTGFTEISKIERDLAFVCPASLHTNAYFQIGETVFRYVYGASFPNLQVLGPSLGAFHGSELPLLFGTFDTTGATPAEAQLSKTFQTMVANFVKNPRSSPAPNFPKYNPNLNTLAELAFNGNVETDNVVQTVSPAQFDKACLALWDQILLA